MGLTLVAMFTACRQDEKLSNKSKLIEVATETKGEGVVDSVTGETFYPAEDLQQEKDSNLPVTRISYTESNVDLGEVAEGEIVKHVFEFKNTGNAPLIIQSAQGSCGCTVPKYSKDPIAPGKKGQIAIEFDSNGRPGANTKTVTVNANTLPQATTLSFTVTVSPKTK